MTLLEKNYLVLKDLEVERTEKNIEAWWASRLDQKIADIKLSIMDLEKL